MKTLTLQQKFNTLKNLLYAALVLTAIQSCSKGGSTPTPDPVKPPDVVIPVVTVPASANFDKLTAWSAFKASQSAPYNMVMIGDSYTQGNFFTWQLRAKLLGDGYVDGGPGYCSFGRYDPTGIYSIDASMDPAELTATYDPAKWVSQDANTYGPCDYVTNNAANAVITVKSTVSLNSITLIFERHASSGDFRYRVNAGAWTTVSAVNATQDINTLAVDVSGAGSTINLDIEPLKAGEIFCGALAKRTGNVLTLDKVGSSGATANIFAQNELWKTSLKALNPNGAVILFGTNEMDKNVTPAQMKANVQNIITKLREINPSCDIMIVCPPETKFESEDPRTYKIANYAEVLYKLATETNSAFVNLGPTFGKFSQASITSGLMDVDRKHPGDKGGDLIATTIFAAYKK